MSDAVLLRCNNCGAALTVPGQVRFVTCEHCQASLQVRREGGAAFTEVAERLERVEGRLDRVQAEQELARLDREWEKEKAGLMIDSRRGQTVPTAGAAVAIGVVTVGGGLALTLLSPSGALTAMGIGMAAIGIGATVYLARRAQAYAEASRRYERRRRDLESRLGG